MNYQEGDMVLKKSLSMGYIAEGVIVHVYAERIRIKWLPTGFRSTTKPESVLPHTPENVALLEGRLEKREQRQGVA